MDHSRRKLFGLRSESPNSGDKPMRPPWALSEISFLESCTRCDRCINVCPQNILERGQGGYPVVDFASAECTFCAKCVDECESGALSDPNVNGAWQYVASVSDSCLPHSGVACQSCADSCDVNAIRFSPRLGGPSIPELDQDACTGCGACYSICPTGAISFAERIKSNEAREAI